MLPQLICIVDDEADYRLCLQQLFRHFLPTYSVRLFDGGQALIEQLPYLSQQPSLILLDRHMPGLNGYQTLMQLKQWNMSKKIPVVMMSADASAVEINSCYEAGANSFLLKQLEFNSLRELIETVCQYWIKINQAPVEL